MAGIERIAIFLRVLVLAAGVWLAPALAADDFESGNQFYERGKFSEAKHEYERELAAGGAGANLYYNLGNTEYRLGSIGAAILNYERALALDPRHPEARSNLQFLRERAGAKLPEVSPVGRVIATQPLNFWLVLAVASAWALVFALALLLTSRGAPAGGWWLLVVVSALIATVGAFGWWSGWKDRALAIIIAPATEARLAPAASAPLAEALPPGSRVRVMSERGDWVYCELPGASRGWIPRRAVERVRSQES
jgi:tetratricopeptide (TPR) repeat protein